MRKALCAIVALVAMPLAAQTADDIVSKYINAIGGMDKLQAVKTTRSSGKFTGGGGFEARVVEEKKRPDEIRQEFQIQGMVGVNAYDGKSGWKIEPWNGKKDAEPLGEDELKEIVEDSDFDGPLVNYATKGNKVEYMGVDQVEGDDTYKLKVTLKNGDVQYYYMDPDYYVPIKIGTTRFVRGEQRDFETTLGDYKQVAGVYFPYSFESGVKGSPNKSKVTIEKIEVNVPLAESLFVEPRQGGQLPAGAPDASNMQPKAPQQKPASEEPKKPPVAGVILSREDGEESQIARLEILPLRCAQRQDDSAVEER
ncbi:MAG TPA: hypothetical protein VJ853_00390 [Thermoanaerobaculia bacterium]|nr:hypothetical protein [Thermoanaerobaculia bacterium]